MSFTDQKPRIYTEEEALARARAGRKQEEFRCYLCGHTFVLGDYYRWVFDNDSNSSGFGNFFTCRTCDGPTVREEWHMMGEVLRRRYWWILRDLREASTEHYPARE